MRRPAPLKRVPVRAWDASPAPSVLQSFAELRSHRNQPGIWQLADRFCRRGVIYVVGKLIGVAVTA
jgi:hypothetical protein